MITTVDKDYDSLSIVVVAEFDAPAERVWELWADPRKLERWWGPPSHPATIKEFDLSPGGMVTYFMTGPDGETYHGWWRVTAVNPPKSLEYVDGFADQDGTPAENMPVTTGTMTLTEEDGRTRMEVRSVYASREDLDKVVEMGALEGVRQAVGQMDALLAA